MKLYVTPGACSMSCHIAFEESRLAFEAIVSPWSDKERWKEISALNPQHAVPVLVLDDGRVLTQNIAILSYVGEKVPESRLLPAPGSFARAEVFQWLSWVGADLHKAFGPLFDRECPADVREVALKEVHELLAQAEKQVLAAGGKYLLGEAFTVADTYLFTVYGWCRIVKVPTERYVGLTAYAARVAERPAVRTVLKREGLLRS